MHLLEVHFDFLCHFRVLALVVIAGAVPMSETIALKAGEDVEVGVENDLASDGVIVHFDVDAIGAERTFYCD